MTAPFQYPTVAVPGIGDFIRIRIIVVTGNLTGTLSIKGQ